MSTKYIQGFYKSLEKDSNICKKLSYKMLGIRNERELENFLKQKQCQ